MAAPVAISYRPHRHQLAFHKAPHRIKALIAGARSGKTKAGAAEVIIRAINQPGYQPRDIAVGKNYTIAVGAPRYRELWDIVIPEIFRTMPSEMIVDWSKSEKRLTIRGRGRGRYTDIIFRSADAAEKWEGIQLYAAWLDECAQINAAVYDEVRTRLIDRRGTLLLTGTPKGKNWVYKEIYRRSIKHPDEIFCRVYPTADNPYFPKEELVREKARMPARYYKRTFLASFDEFAGQVYEMYSPSVHIVDKYPKHSDGRHMFVKIVAGVDWGYTNRGVIEVFGLMKNGDWYAIDEESDSRVLVAADPKSDSWVRRGRRLSKAWAISGFYCDPSEPEHIETFKRNGLRALPARNAVDGGIQDVATMLHVHAETKRPRLYIVGHRCPSLVEYLPAYHYKETKDGKVTEEPEKVEDHECDALRYAVHTELRKGPEPRFVDKAFAPY